MLVNCTGPGHAGMVATSPLLESLADAGLVDADPLGLGLRTDRSDHAIDHDGRRVDGLFVAGPPARSSHGELMGLPQVSRQPRDIARRIAARARLRPAEP